MNIVIYSPSSCFKPVFFFLLLGTKEYIFKIKTISIDFHTMEVYENPNWGAFLKTSLAN